MQSKLALVLMFVIVDVGCSWLAENGRNPKAKSHERRHQGMSTLSESKLVDHKGRKGCRREMNVLNVHIEGQKGEFATPSFENILESPSSNCVL